MPMRDDVEAIRALREATQDAARPRAVAQQKALGKLTARRRLELLCDPGSFVEFGQLARAPNIVDRESPADGVIIGIGKAGGRRVAVVDYDFTVMGGSQGEVNHAKTDHIHKIALEQGIPVVYLLDGGGARAQDLDSFRYYFPEMWFDQVRMTGWVPMVAGVMGPSFAGHANLAGLCDLVVMVEPTSSLGVAGVHLVRASLGMDITPQQLGGARMHAEVSGCADVLVADDEECIGKLKQFLSLLPGNAGEAPPVIPCDDPPDRREEFLLDILPSSPRRSYDMYRIIRAVVDRGEIFDLKPDWAKNVITCLGRLAGRPVGFAASQPLHMAGVIDTPASEKMAHFVEMCDAFGLPIVLLADVPGFMAGPECERTGLVRRSMKTLYALGHCTVPIVSVVIRKSYGMGGYVMGSRGFRPNMLLAWPSGEMGGMGLEGAVEILHRKRIAASDNPDQLRAQLVDELYQKMRAVPTAKVYGFDDIIDPRDTRSALIRALESLPRRDPCLPRKKHGISPF